MDEELRGQRELFERAVNQRDRDAALAVLHDDYALVLVAPAAAVMPRERWLELLPEYVVHGWETEEELADVDGDTAAILQRVRMQATVLGEDRSGLFAISDIWRRGDD